jgi:hypothetical protein
MPVPLLDLRAQHAHIRDEVVAAMMGVVESQSFILGEPVATLEADVARLSRTKHAIGCASGTDALLLAFRALDIGRGDVLLELRDGLSQDEQLRVHDVQHRRDDLVANSGMLRFQVQQRYWHAQIIAGSPLNARTIDMLNYSGPRRGSGTSRPVFADS